MKWYIKVWQNLFNFEGRARRKEYWNFVLFHFLILIVLAFISVYMHSMTIYYVYSYATVIPAIAAGVRRMHDINKSGWYILIPIYSLILACTEGDHGENGFGLDPKTNMPDFEFEHDPQSN